MKDKPVISNQHGALVMALVPFFYGMFAAEATGLHLSLGIAWLFLYFCSYPFFSLFSKKPTERNKKWALIYFVLSLFSALPLLWAKPKVLLFAGAVLPLVWLQIYYAKRRDERNLINDIAGILTFGVIGMASFYLPTERLNWAVLLHPTLFFTATALYIKSMVRERKNPRYMELSIASHLLLAVAYLLAGYTWLFAAYLIALARAIIVPAFGLNVKQVGMAEFPVVVMFLICVLMGEG